MQLQEVLTETADRNSLQAKISTTLRNSTAVYQCAVPMEAMQDYDEQHCRLHPLCHVAQLVYTHKFDALSCSCYFVSLEDTTPVSSRSAPMYRTLGA